MSIVMMVYNFVKHDEWQMSHDEWQMSHDEWQVEF